MMNKTQIVGAITGCVVMFLSIPVIISPHFIPAISEYISAFAAFGCLGVGFAVWTVSCGNEIALFKYVSVRMKRKGEKNEQ